MNAARAHEALTTSRARTDALTAADDIHLTSQVDPLMSPLVWDLAHIGQQEELWLLRHLEHADAMLRPEVDDLYDAFEHPRATRPSLPLLPPAEARRYLGEVRARVVDRLAAGAPDFVHGLVVQHENQHVETMLGTHQLRTGARLLTATQEVPAGRPVAGDAVTVAGGPCVLGVDGSDEPWSLDNERPAHRVFVPTFRIARHPVTNAQWQAFVDDGGYDRPELWQADGWTHRLEAGLLGPKFWQSDGTVLRFGTRAPLVDDEPVQHVCFWEADAYARWAGGRLPTELEWEKACAWDPVAGARRRWPWGDEEWSRGAGQSCRGGRGVAAGAGRRLSGRRQRLRRRAAHRRRVGVDLFAADAVARLHADGLRHLLGAVLRRRLPRAAGAGRGRSAPDAVRPSFRNWDLPIRRQIFSGVRVAWDV